MNKNSLSQKQFYIDKTEELQKGIEGFPFVYIEGFASCGKSVAVKMLLEKYPEAEKFVVDMAQKAANSDWELDIFLSYETKHTENEETISCFVVFENMNTKLSDADRQQLTAFLNRVPAEVRVIFVSRERPDECLLPFIWERKMEIIPQEALMFSKSEIQKLIMEMGCDVSAKDIYEQSGGWAGCVDMMLRLAKRQEKYSEGIIDAKELRRSYEIEQYIQYTIMGALKEDEKNFLERIIGCPFVNEKLCKDIFGCENSKELLERLRRKGILKYEVYRKYWKVAKAFCIQREWEEPEMWKRLAEWYAKEGYIREAIVYVKNTKDEEAFLQYLQKYYDKIEPADIPGELVLSKKRNMPEMCYLQGIYNYMHQDFIGVDREIVRLEKMQSADEFTKYEILLNLYYLKPDFTTSQWITLLAKYGEIFAKEQKKFRLYHMLGHSHTYLCGLRDLSALFACGRKEENQNARSWRSFLGEDEWKCYQLARIDYYLETERQDKIGDEDWNLFYKEDISQGRNRARLYLAGKLMKTEPTIEYEEYFAKLGEQLKNQPDEAGVTNAIICLYSRWTKDSHLMVHWLRYSENAIRADINEQNYTELCFIMKGYLLLNQFEKAERIVRKMIPYLQKYHRTRLLTEILFQQAIVNWETERHGQALQNTIESFMVGAQYRYVGFYTNYGMTGNELLEAYEDWCRKNIPERWNRKKKYQYGNVLRMPEADYLGVILRLAHKGRQANRMTEGSGKLRTRDIDGIRAERLTMMEIMVLQAISRGSTNAQICEQLNLKLPTVKTHIYSIYKKLGVGSRVQAVNKGKEMGVL